MELDKPCHLNGLQESMVYSRRQSRLTHSGGGGFKFRPGGLDVFPAVMGPSLLETDRITPLPAGVGWEGVR